MINNEISIGMNGSMLDDKPTGVGVYAFNLINNLSNIAVKNNWKEITVFTPTSLLLNRNLTVIKLSSLLQSSKHGKLAAFSRFIWNTFYYPIQARKFNLLISPTTHGSFLLNNQIITIHDLISLHYKNISPHQRFYFKYLLPFLIRRAALIIAVSENTKRDIIHFFKCPEDKIRVIYNGYDDAIYYPADENTSVIYEEYKVKNYLLAIGPTYPHKNFEMLITAYKDLTEVTKKKYPLVIAGGKEKYLFLLKQYVKNLGLEKSIYFIDYVPIRFMPSLYREAFALVFPSLYEGFGIPLLEAMACGCPVMSSNTSSMPEVCGNAALYFNPLDKLSLISSIQEIILNNDLRNDLVTKGFERVKEFSWKKMAQAFNTEIENHFINN